MKLRVAIGADHGGFTLKEELVARLKDNFEFRDVGAHAVDLDDDYPDFAEPVARAVAAGEADRGIIVCGSGVGACIAANKVPGIRAGLCHDNYSARQGVEHDDMNILCLGARVVGGELAAELATTFLGVRFSGEPRHRRRLDKVASLERSALEGIREKG